MMRMPQVPSYYKTLTLTEIEDYKYRTFEKLENDFDSGIKSIQKVFGW